MAFRAAEYERFHGNRSSLPAWWPIFKATMHRGWKVTWVRRICLGALVSAFGLTLMFYMLYKVIPGWRELMQQFGQMVDPEEKLPFKIDARFYAGILKLYIYPVLLPLSVLFGQDLISSDMRTRALEAYFARPLTPLTYLLGRTFAFLAFLLGATLLPLLWVWCFDVLTAPTGHFELVSMVPKGIFLSFGGVSLVLALLIQAVSSSSKSSTWTSMGLIVLFILSTPIAHILHELTDMAGFLALSIPESIGIIIYSALDLGEKIDSDHASPIQAIFLFAGIALLSLIILWRRILRKGVVG